MGLRIYVKVERKDTGETKTVRFSDSDSYVFLNALQDAWNSPKFWESIGDHDTYEIIEISIR